MESKEEFHFFSGKESPLHPQHKAEFQVHGVKYNFVEQYVLHKKAGMISDVISWKCDNLGGGDSLITVQDQCCNSLITSMLDTLIKSLVL